MRKSSFSTYAFNCRRAQLRTELREEAWFRGYVYIATILLLQKPYSVAMALIYSTCMHVCAAQLLAIAAEPGELH